MPERESFGRTLSRLRLQRGLSLARLAERVNYSRGHLGNVENGTRRPNLELARLCDAELQADGALVRLVTRAPARPPVPGTAGAVGEAAPALPAQVPHPAGPIDEPVLAAMRAVFDNVRVLGQALGASVVLGMVVDHASTMRSLADVAGGADRPRAQRLAARFAEYAGWMAQEAGAPDLALRWTETAARLARAGGDPALVSYTHVRKALLALYDDDALGTIALAGRAYAATGVAPRVRGLAALRLAQGHALAGDERACLPLLDEARELLAADPGDASAELPPLGAQHVPDVVATTTAWALYDLGRPAAAAEILDREVARIAPTARRSQVRYGTRRAMAHLAAGELDHACDLIVPLLDEADTVRSATVAVDLVRLRRELIRRLRHPPVRALYPRLLESINQVRSGTRPV
ncbi:helix-turn-helix transcriptional regulator [Micromonospora sp. CPCC 205561]|uniref:helix-turn-helix transcriptional regulator n=1 Tax=Micromonospora sp. CPCC 205561 TaxID=3122407 RepID=UPI002FF2E3B3